MLKQEVDLDQNQSGFSDEEIVSILNSWIKIIKIGDDSKMIPIADGYLVKLYKIMKERDSSLEASDFETDNDDYDSRFIDDELDDLDDEIEKCQRRIKDGTIEDLDFETLEEAIERIRSVGNKRKRANHQNRIDDLIDTGMKVIYEAKKTYHMSNIEKCLTETISSISSSKRIFREMDESYYYLKQIDMLDDELKGKIRKAKERAAWNRANKKLNEAEIAKAVGKTDKYDKSMAEARVMLKQDWNEAFPDEPVPEIEG